MNLLAGFWSQADPDGARRPARRAAASRPVLPGTAQRAVPASTGGDHERRRQVPRRGRRAGRDGPGRTRHHQRPAPGAGPGRNSRHRARKLRGRHEPDPVLRQRRGSMSCWRTSESAPTAAAWCWPSAAQPSCACSRSPARSPSSPASRAWKKPSPTPPATAGRLTAWPATATGRHPRAARRQAWRPDELRSRLIHSGHHQAEEAPDELASALSSSSGRDLAHSSRSHRAPPRGGGGQAHRRPPGGRPELTCRGLDD